MDVAVLNQHHTDNQQQPALARPWPSTNSGDGPVASGQNEAYRLSLASIFFSIWGHHIVLSRNDQTELRDMVE
jgi:hypothetical protein